MQQINAQSRLQKPVIALLAVTLVALCWSFWTTLGDVSQRWSSDPQYSHGYLVPIFAVILLWLRREKLNTEQMTPSWWGAALLAVGLGLRLYGTWYHYLWFDHISLLPCIAGLCLLLGGWAAWKWAWPAILFLFFMIPLPYSVATSMSGPLQKLATVTSTWSLQTLGLPALAEGNVILIDENRIGIVEACSGLRMLVVFFALATGMALLVKRPVIDKVILVASAIPIALISNVIRVTVTGLLYVTVENNEVAEVFFHDVAGWLMMPLALGMLWIELKILDKLLIDTEASSAHTQRRSPRTEASPMVRSRRRDRKVAEPEVA